MAPALSHLVGLLLLATTDGVSGAGSRYDAEPRHHPRPNRHHPWQAALYADAPHRESNPPPPTNSSVLEVFQLATPALTVTPDTGSLALTDGSPNGTVRRFPSQHSTCRETLAVYTFASSYGQPFVGTYTPPACDFNRVAWNLTVTSKGRQFDRLGSVSLGDVEVFRTSTAEPTSGGIVWTFVKDMSNFLPLFKEEQTLIFDLGNIIDGVYTGPFNVTLTSSFFTVEESTDAADLILPISKRQGSIGQPSYYQVPNETAANALTLPQNVKKAVVTVSATGQAAEEFWWSNVPQSDTDTFPDYGTLYGYSPFREVQLFLDGSLAGVAWPFPIIFTGGVVPGLWRPLVGIDAFDLKEDEIDVSPWLPLLCDGQPHTFELRVSGLNDTADGSAVLAERTEDYWWLSGKVFIWLDEPGHITTGTGPTRSQDTLDLAVSSHVTANASTIISANHTVPANTTLTYTTTARRTLAFNSTLHLSTGAHPATWSQTLAFTNNSTYTAGGNTQRNAQRTTGTSTSSSGYNRTFSYPLDAYSAYTTDRDNFTIVADIRRGKDERVVGPAVFPTGLDAFVAAGLAGEGEFEGVEVRTRQEGHATYISNSTTGAAVSFGDTEQKWALDGVRVGGMGCVGLWRREVSVRNGSVVEHSEGR